MGYNKIDDYIEAYDRLIQVINLSIQDNLKHQFIIVGNLAKIMDTKNNGTIHPDTETDYSNNANINIISDKSVWDDEGLVTYDFIPMVKWTKNTYRSFNIEYYRVNDISTIPVDGITEDGYKYNYTSNILGLLDRLSRMKSIYCKHLEKIGDCFYKLNMEEFPELNKAIEQSKDNLRVDCVKELQDTVSRYLPFMVDQIELKYYVP